MKSNLEIVGECDSFPYPGTPAHDDLLSTLYTLLYTSPTTGDETPIGYLPTAVFNRLAKVPIALKGELEATRARALSAFMQPTEPARSAAVAATLAHWRAAHTFTILAGWRNELYPVYGPANELLFTIERSAASLFGLVTYGVHMMAYTRDPSASWGIKLWIPRRARTKQTYPGMLDNTVAGGIAAGEQPFECLVREADEEASLPEALVREHAKAVGTVTYAYLRDERAGGETGLVQPECQWVYELELPAGTEPRTNDSEVEAFYLWSVEEVQAAMGRGEFKPNCAVVVLDFFLRWGVLTRENEVGFEEIQKRIHRELMFPGPWRGEAATLDGR